jgi:hypothetical protein
MITRARYWISAAEIAIGRGKIRTTRNAGIVEWFVRSNYIIVTLKALLNPMLNFNNRNRSKFYLSIFPLAWIAGMWSALVVGAEGGLLSPTEETDIGIYYVPGAPEIRNLWQEGDPGERLLLRGRALLS